MQLTGNAANASADAGGARAFLVAVLFVLCVLIVLAAAIARH
jgi:hypothetical protein